MFRAHTPVIRSTRCCNLTSTAPAYAPETCWAKETSIITLLHQVGISLHFTNFKNFTRQRWVLLYVNLSYGIGLTYIILYYIILYYNLSYNIDIDIITTSIVYCIFIFFLIFVFSYNIYLLHTVKISEPHSNTSVMSLICITTCKNFIFFYLQT